MISLETMQRARDWVISEITTNRTIIPMPFDADEARNLGDQDLMELASQSPLWEFSKPTPMRFPKVAEDDYRLAHYIPTQDRIILTAVLLKNYDRIYNYIKPFNGGVNYDRPLLEGIGDGFLEVDYHERYLSFKQRIWEDEKDDKWIVHTDIRNFASSCQSEHVLKKLHDIGFDAEDTEIFDNAFKAWKSYDLQGVPQGYILTDFLLKIYLCDVDGAMTDMAGVDYYRYVDDIIISVTSKDDTKQTLSHLEECLSEQGLSLKQTFTHFAGPQETGYGHSYNPRNEIEEIKNTIEMANSLLPLERSTQLNFDHADLVKIAYEKFMSPTQSTAQKPKYIVSYLLGQMRKYGIDIFVPDMENLLSRYPDRTTKLLKSLDDVQGDAFALNGFANFFCSDLDDHNKDGVRMEYFSVLREKGYPISQYDMGVIKDGLDDLSKTENLFQRFSYEVSAIYNARFCIENAQAPKRTR